MNWGLFAMLVGFLLPLTLVVRVGTLASWERGRGVSHPLIQALLAIMLVTLIPVIALVPSVLTVMGKPSPAGVLLLEYAGTGWGGVKLAVTILAVFFADYVMPRMCAQLIVQPISDIRPTRTYLVRDGGVVVMCLLLAWLGAR